MTNVCCWCRNPYLITVEGKLFEALTKAGAIPPNPDPKKVNTVNRINAFVVIKCMCVFIIVCYIRFCYSLSQLNYQRCSRTDKGVSAARLVVSLKISISL